jgi:hypothetical protein
LEQSAFRASIGTLPLLANVGLSFIMITAAGGKRLFGGLETTQTLRYSQPLSTDIRAFGSNYTVSSSGSNGYNPAMLFSNTGSSSTCYTNALRCNANDAVPAGLGKLDISGCLPESDHLRFGCHLRDDSPERNAQPCLQPGGAVQQLAVPDGGVR